MRIVWPEIRRAGAIVIAREDGQPVPYHSVPGDPSVTRQIPVSVLAGDVSTENSILLGRNHDMRRPGKYRIQFPETKAEGSVPPEVTNPTLPASNVLEFKNAPPSVAAPPAAAQSGSAQETGEVELLILAPAGRPAAGAEVLVSPTDRPPFRESPRPQSAETDENGRIVLPWPAGVLTMRVSVKGVGYGVTGLAQVLPGKRVKASLPPLAAWATIRGQVPTELLTANTRVELAARNGGQEPAPVTPDGQGAFQVEVPAGSWYVCTSEKKERTVEVSGEIVALPGQVVTVGPMDKVLPPESPNPAAAPPKGPTPLGERPTVTLLTGTVRDLAGKPVAGARVYAVMSCLGGLRPQVEVLVARADQAGRYEIVGQDYLRWWSMTLIAHAPGFCPTWSWPPRLPAGFRTTAEPPAPVLDFVLTDQGGTLEVEALRGGKPAPDIYVLARLQDADLWEAAIGGDLPEYDALEQAVEPIAKTDARGVARFEKLVPGNYRIIAREVEPTQVRYLRTRWGRRGRQTFGEAYGLGVRKGAVTRHRLPIYPQQGQSEVRVLGADGKPLAGVNGSLESSPIDELRNLRLRWWVVPIDYSCTRGGGCMWGTPNEEGIATCDLDAVKFRATRLLVGLCPHPLCVRPKS